jgi:hypothetical protein
VQRLPEPVRPAARTRALALGAAFLLLLRGAVVALDDPRASSSPPSQTKNGAPSALLPDRDAPALEPAVRCDDRSSALTSSSAQPRPAFWAAPAASPRPANALRAARTDILLVQALVFEHYLDYRESLSAP